MTEDRSGRSWGAAAAWLAVCSLLFFGVYGGCNWITSLRSDVGTLFFKWELRIPFVPAMILPYWSIDLFFVGSFFVCTGKRELSTLGKRIALAILASGACFLLFPLTIGFPRPEAPGLWGDLFGLLRGFDRPYNLVPSLHIALRAILVYAYARHTRGVLRVAVHLWFSLIGFSTVLTYQHHLADVAGGFLLGALCFHAFREEETVWAVVRNPRVGAYYAAGFLPAVGAAVALQSWWMFLLWPATSFGIAAAGYFGAGASIYRKSGGRIPISTRIVLAPILLGQWVSLLHYRRQCRPWDPVTPSVWIGRRLDGSEAAEAIRRGVSAVLDLTGEFSEAAPFLGGTYLNLPVLDLTAPTPDQLKAAVRFIMDQSARGVVYVHCKIGYSRSAAAVGAYLLAGGHAGTVEEVVALLKRVRPSIVIRPEVRTALEDFRGGLVP